MATLRERKPGVWEIRVFTGSDSRGRPTQLSKTIHGGKREAQRVAAEMEAGGRVSSGGRLISDVPSKIVWLLASRCQRSTGYSRV